MEWASEVKMCFAVNQENRKAIEKQLEFWTKRELALIGWAPKRWMDAFAHPLLPVVLNDHSVELASWGLIPGWVKDDAKAKELSNMTLNAKIETIFELPSFRASAPGKRCLIPVNGFFEYQHLNKSGEPDPLGKLTKPFFLQIEGRECYYLGGLTSTDRNGQLTFSICTKPANTLMRRIHNAKLRMPVIVSEEWAEGWLATGKAEDIEPFKEPRDDDGLIAEETKGKPKKGEENE